MEPTFIPSRQFTVCEIDLVYKPTFEIASRPTVGCSKDAYSILIETWDCGKLQLVEHFRVLYLNIGNHVQAVYLHSTGSISSTLADPRLIFLPAIRMGASGIIIAHNHPSGDMNPSRADIALTRKISSGAELLNIKLLDHLIITPDKYFSFGDEGLL